QVEHVVEEAHARVAGAEARPFQAQRQAYLGLARPALDCARPIAHVGGLSPMRASIERACHSKPSARAIEAPDFASLATPRGPMRTSAMRRRKWRADSVEAKRAAPPVGSTWLEPAT